MRVSLVPSFDSYNPHPSVAADDWPSDEKIMQYRERCATHRRYAYIHWEYHVPNSSNIQVCARGCTWRYVEGYIWEAS